MICLFALILSGCGQDTPPEEMEAETASHDVTSSGLPPDDRESETQDPAAFSDFQLAHYHQTAQVYEGDAYFISPQTMYAGLRRDGAIYSLDGDHTMRVVYPLGVDGFYIMDDFIYTTSGLEISMDGETVRELFDGRLEYVDTHNQYLYFTATAAANVDGASQAGFFRYSIGDGTIDTLLSGSPGYVELVYKEQDGIYLCHAQPGQSDLYHGNADGTEITLIATDTLDAIFGDDYPGQDSLAITTLKIEDGQIHYSVGCYQGSGGYFYGNDYRMDLDGGNKEEVDYRMDAHGAIKEGIDLGADVRTAYDFNDNISVDFKYETDGEYRTVSLSAEALGMQEYMQDNDKIYYKNIEVIEDWIYFNSQAWGHRGWSGWRDDFLAGGVYRVRADGSELQTLDMYYSEKHDLSE